MAMYPVYTGQFEILPHDGQTGRNCVQHILEIVETRMRQNYRDERTKLQFQLDGIEHNIDGGDRYKLTRPYFEEHAELTTLEWIVNRGKKAHSLRLRIARLEDQIEVTVRQQSSHHCDDASTPRVVQEIVID